MCLSKTWQVHCFCSSIFAAFTQCVCPKTWQVTVLSLLCSTKVQFFHRSWIRSFTFDLFLDNFSLLIAQCICPKTWQVLCLLPYSGSDHSHFAIWLFSALFCTPLPVFGLLHCYLSQFLFFSYLFWLHSVSVQRRDRCIVTYSPNSVPFTDPLRFGCPPPFYFFPSNASEAFARSLHKLLLAGTWIDMHAKPSVKEGYKKELVWTFT